MNVLTYNPDVMTKSTVIPLGRACECRATRIDFMVASWLARFPGGSIILYIKDPNGETYLAAIRVADGMASWVIRATDTTTPGFGSLELALVGANGEKKLSAVATTKLDKSLVESETDGDHAQPWLEQAAEYQAATETAARAAAEHAAGAATSADQAAASAAAAVEAAEGAEAARTVAEQSIQASAEAAANAERAVQAADAAASSAQQASAAATNAVGAASTAKASATEASDNAAQAASNAGQANRYKEQALSYASIASTKANAAAASEQGAGESAKAAEESAKAAAADAQTAREAATAATAAADSAADSAAHAHDSEQAAAQSAETATAAADAAAADAAHADSVAASIPDEYTALSDVVHLKAPAIICEQSGDIVGVNDAAAERAVSVVSHIAAADGVTEVSLTRTGKNLFGGLTLARSIKDANEKVTLDEDARTVRYHASWVSTKRIFDKFKEETPYTFMMVAAAENTAATPNMMYRYIGGESVNALGKFDADNMLLHTTLDKASINALVGYNSGGYTTLLYEQCGVFEGALTMEDFEPYMGETLTVALPETVTSGTFDWTTGILTINQDGTPRIVQLAPQRLDMLKGCNVLWSSTGATELRYVADTKSYIDNLFAQIASNLIDA